MKYLDHRDPLSYEIISKKFVKFGPTFYVLNGHSLKMKTLID